MWKFLTGALIGFFGGAIYTCYVDIKDPNWAKQRLDHYVEKRNNSKQEN